MPIAISMKKVEKPVTEISRNLWSRLVGWTSRRVFFFVKKWESMTRMEMTVPMAVASPAPNAPISQVKTKK